MATSQGWYEKQIENYMWKHFSNVCPALFKKELEEFIVTHTIWQYIINLK